MGLVRRTYALPIEMAVLAVAVLLWQLARIPLEASLQDALATTRDWISVERALGIFVEPDIVRWTYARPDLLGAANWFYSHMDETLVFGAFAALRLLDPPEVSDGAHRLRPDARARARGGGRRPHGPAPVGGRVHFFLDAVVGIGCAAIGVAGALLIHGRVPRGRPDAGPVGIALAVVAWAAIAFAVNVVVMAFAG